jgi:outer membrane protein, multidrug efflux system
MRPAIAKLLWRLTLPIAGLIGLMLLSGCLLMKEPPTASRIRDQTLAHATLPPQWTGAPTTLGAVHDGWLATFQDSTLEALVSEALAYNTDLRVAAARVEQARGYAKAAGAAIYPSVGLLAHGGTNLGGGDTGLTGLIVSASWEFDLWGRVSATRKATEAEYNSAAVDYVYAQQSLAALVAKSWFLATEARLQIGIAAEMVQTSEKLAEMARQRKRVGAGDDLDLAVAEANLGTIRDTLLQLEFGYKQSQRALEVLLGRYPSASLAAAASLPVLPPPVPAGLPSELLERRPDVIAAERRVAAAFNRVIAAKAAQLPTISLTASGSNLSSDFFVLQDRENPLWSAGANLLAPIYQGGALQAQVQIRNAEQKQALAEYARAGLRAFSDVENSLSSESTLRTRERILTQAAADQARAVEFAWQRYRIGAVDLRAVSQQQLAAYAAQSALLRVQSEARVQRVNLYLALGGDFSAPPSTPKPVADGNPSTTVGNSSIESQAAAP